MKNTTLIIWNVVLTIGAVIILTHIFMERNEGGGKKENTPANKTSMSSDSATSLCIAYVKIDTLEAHYELFIQKKKELDAKQQQAEALLNKKMDAFQNDYTAAQQQAATMTQLQLEAIQEKLQKEQADIQQSQTSLQTEFQNQIEKFNHQLKDSLDSFLKTYNADKRFAYVLSYSDASDILFAQPQYDITDDAVKGMNERLKKK